MYVSTCVSTCVCMYVCAACELTACPERNSARMCTLVWVDGSHVRNPPRTGSHQCTCVCMRVRRLRCLLEHPRLRGLRAPPAPPAVLLARILKHGTPSSEFAYFHVLSLVCLRTRRFVKPFLSSCVFWFCLGIAKGPFPGHLASLSAPSVV